MQFLKSKNKNGKRILMAVLGVLVCGISVGLFKLSVFGTDPYQCFVTGLWNITNISYGTVYVILTSILFVIVFFIDKHYIGIATFINMFGTGYIVEFTTKNLERWIISPNIATRVILLFLGILIMCFSSSLYYTADLGVSTYDAIALILTNKKVARFEVCRIATDIICVIIGILLKATVGIGTILTAFFMGPLIEFFNVHFSRPFLQNKD